MVSIIGFGGIKLPQVSADDADEILNLAVDKGINFVDTATGYGDSEEKIGRALSGRRDEVCIATKTMSTTRDEAWADLEDSLRKLRTDYIDLYQFHNLRFPEQYEQVMGDEGFMAAMEEAREQGLVRHIGFSSHRYHETMKRAILSGRFETGMFAYNILNDEMVDDEVLPLASAHDIGVIIMKPLAGGALTQPPAEIREQTGFGITAADALRFVLANKHVTVAIPGMRSKDEVRENVETAETLEQLSAERTRELVEAAEALGKDFCRTCWYCMPCEQGIKIPVILRHLGYAKRFPGLLQWAKGRYSMVEVKAVECDECGECEEKCPYELPVREMLAEAHEMLS
jgi:predicted aldo/keto reductase-like oxidoreductase